MGNCNIYTVEMGRFLKPLYYNRSSRVLCSNTIIKIFDERRDNRLKCQGLWSPLNQRNGAEKADHMDHNIHYC